MLNRTPQEDLWVHYFTSSKYIKRLINKYGKGSFEFSILIEDKDYDKCYLFEQQLIDKNIKNELCLNKYCHLNCRFHTAGIKRESFSEEWKQKMSDSHKGERNINYGKPMSSEAKVKLSNTKRGKKQTEEHKKKNSDSHAGENNHMFGKTHTPESLQKIKDAANNRPSITCPHCGKMGKSSAMRRWHFDNCKMF